MGAVVVSLSSCANSPLGQSVERSLAADPRLEENADPSASPTPAEDATVVLPTNFPGEIPRYPEADLVEIVPASDESSATNGERTRWTTPDSAEQVQRFYQTRLQEEGWTIEQAETSSDNSTPGNSTALRPITARWEELQLTVEVIGSSDTTNASSGNTEFILAYQVQSDRTPPTSSPSPSLTDAWTQRPPESTTRPSARPSPNPSSSPTTRSQTFTDLDQSPPELQRYITDLAKLGVFQSASGETTASTEFKPNTPVTRREYARWLVTANNLMYGDRPAQQIRLGTASDQPAFQDVPRTDPDFAAIQGLAEAGLIPSPLSGDSTTVTFRPDAPLTRESLILWKIPADIRQPLPNATVDSVQQTWGFQDAARIDPRSLRAVLADYQNGDMSNIRRAFGFTTLFQPKASVTRAEAAATLWYFGSQNEGISAEDTLKQETE